MAEYDSDFSDEPKPDVVTVYKDHQGEWRWHRVAPNGNVIADSGEGYTNKGDACSIAERVNDAGDNGVRFRIAGETDD